MTIEEAQALCFESRPVDYSEVVELRGEDLKYDRGDTVYFKPLKEILKNPRITSCEVVDNRLVEITVDDGGTFRADIATWENPKTITGFEEYTLDSLEIEVFYYILSVGWADEYMLQSTPPQSKKQKLLNSIKDFR